MRPYLGHLRRVSGQGGWHRLMMLTRDHIYVKFVHEKRPPAYYFLSIGV
jgi:hypothetical protein